LGVTAGDILEVTNESSHSISFNPVRILRENNHPRETKTFLKFLTIPDSQASQKDGKYVFGQIHRSSNLTNVYAVFVPFLRIHAKRFNRVQLPPRAPLFYYVKPREVDGEIEIPDGFVLMDYRP
jgi:hypothetical protein